MSESKLNEGTIRQFMKLANLGALTDDFVSKNTINEEAAPIEEEELEEAWNLDDNVVEEAKEDEPEEVEADVEADIDVDVEAEPDIDIEDVGVEEPADAVPGEAELDLSTADVEALTAALPVIERIIAAGGGEPEAELEGELEGEPEEVELAAVEEEPIGAMAGEPPIEEEQEPDGPMYEALVKKIAQRVAKRLQKK